MVLSTPEMVILAEMFLRGPQTLGELRGRASRMHPLESLEMVRNTVEQLMNKPEPLVRRLAPAPGSRAERYGQLMCAALHEGVVSEGGEEGAPSEQPLRDDGRGAGLSERVARLEAEVSVLRGALERLGREMGVEVFEKVGPAAGEGGAAS
jgi:uncharacterized protein YceH (UPF0502 family)